MFDTFANNAKQVYNRLSDDLSKNIFEDRILFSLTDNIDFIRHICSISHGSVYEKCINNAVSFVNRSTNGIIYYGAGYMGAGLISINSKIEAFCDRDVNKIGHLIFGHRVISPDMLVKEYPNSNVVITVIDMNTALEISNELVNMGLNKGNIYHYMDSFGLSSNYFHNLMAEQYFDSEIIVPKLTENEIFVDAGCCNCYTDFRFTEFTNNKYKKIIAFEPSPKQYLECIEKSRDIQNISIHNSGLWNENTFLSFDDTCTIGGTHIIDYAGANATQVKLVKLDDVLDGEEATFIKMDIEGAELNALKGAEQTIIKYRPKLAICVYHKPEDIFEIPSYLLSLHSDYNLYFRHYSFWHGETVLYAV